MIYLFISDSMVLQVLQGPQDEAAAQQPPENRLEPVTCQAVAFKKYLLTEDRVWLFLKSSFQIQGLSGSLHANKHLHISSCEVFIFC